MSWTIGEWKILDEGKVHQALKKCINILMKNKMKLEVKLLDEEIKLENGKDIYEILKDFEKRHGVSDLIEILIDGLNLECRKNGESVNIKVLMRAPSDSDEHLELFKDMIAAWVDQNPLTFSERFFRLPKVTEDIVDRYLDNPLEKTLLRTFGSHFHYKIIVEGNKKSPNLEILRKELHRVIR